jgi:hypothetical protein
MKRCTQFLVQWSFDILGAGIVLGLILLVFSILIIIFAPVIGPSPPLI